MLEAGKWWCGRGDRAGQATSSGRGTSVAGAAEFRSGARITTDRQVLSYCSYVCNCWGQLCSRAPSRFSLNTKD